MSSCTILLSKSDEVYLQKCAAEESFYGIIIGQRAEASKYIVVHLAKNGEEDVEEDLPDADSENGSHNIDHIDTQALTNQWISASKMIPGSFAVLGVFIAGATPDAAEEKTFKIAKKVLGDVHNLLMQGNTFFASIEDTDHADYLCLAYSTATKKAVCKSYSNASNGGSFSPMDCRFVEKPFEWHTFESSYELDDIFPILDATDKINIEHQFQKSMAAVKKSLSASEIFIQNETVDDDVYVDVYVKRKNDNRKRDQPEESYKATIFLPFKCQTHSEHPIKVRQFNGTIRFSGVISSRIWCNAKNSLGDVKRFVRDDILRSLAARIQVYCDGLTEANVSSNAIFISEPPRRVYFNLPAVGTATSPIQFSEYIFRGEAPTVAVAQAKQILDLDINTENIVADLEGLPDDDVFDVSSEAQPFSNHSSTETSSRDLTRTMYILGIAVALLVLVVSVLLHYMLRQ